MDARGGAAGGKPARQQGYDGEHEVHVRGASADRGPGLPREERLERASGGKGDHQTDPGSGQDQNQSLAKDEGNDGFALRSDGDTDADFTRLP